MRIVATSPGRNFDISERISTLKLGASNVGEALNLATINRALEECPEALAQLASAAGAMLSGGRWIVDFPRRAPKVTKK